MKPFRAEYEVLTPDGRGAVGVLSVRGPDAVEAVDGIFRPSTPTRLVESPTGRIRHGRIGPGEGDEVVVVVRPGQSTAVEIHGHGGRAALSMIAEALEAAGIRPISGRPRSRKSPSWDASERLVSAPSLRAAQALIDQASGLLERELERIARLIESDPRAASEALHRLIDRGRSLGLKLAQGWTVTLAGPPNAGKSRLLNAIAGYDRAIVADSPGTTRDVIALATACQGWPIQFEDTAGLRPTDDPLELAGQSRARFAQDQADLVIVVLDGSQPLGEAEMAVLAGYPDALRVASKSDLPAVWPADGLNALPVSGVTGEGVRPMLDAVVDRLIPRPPVEGEPLPTLPEHLARLEAARRCLHGGRDDRARRLLRGWAGRSRGNLPLGGLP